MLLLKGEEIKLINTITNIENKLQPKREKIKQLQMIFIVILLPVVFFIGINARFIFLSLPLIFVFGGYILFKRSDFRHEAKTLILDEVLSSIFDEVTYEANAGLDKTLLKNSELYTMGNEFSSNDLIRGKYQGIQFETSDIHLVEVTHTDKSTTRTTLFLGQWYIFDFFKKFDGYIQIRDKEDRLFKRSYKPVSFFSSRPKANRIKMDHPDFNQVFDVYTSDDQEAFYILTPHFMDALLKLNDVANCEVVVGFVDNQLHVLVNNNKNAFEINVFQPFTLSQYQYLQAESEIIINLIDILKLETDLFK